MPPVLYRLYNTVSTATDFPRGRGPPIGGWAGKVCNYRVQGNCRHGELAMMVVMALYWKARMKLLRVWDFQSAQCLGVINLGGEVGCMISNGPWIFVGIPNADGSILAWKFNSVTNCFELAASLNGHSCSYIISSWSKQALHWFNIV
ncbi:hypothetical protein M0R45_038006 [Rubus argutus]|uniref:Uncharacterized protein n=1 Tax=Rubus argutus TaxID=59490 RepID=A0AAW1W608_RUBAR